MRKPTNSIQAPMTTNLVSTVATASTGALVTSGSALNISNGEVALLSSDLDAADYGELTATPDGNSVKIVQGTPASANIATNDPWQVGDPAKVETDKIYKGKVRSITSVNYNSGALSMSLFSATPTIVVNSTYGMIVELDGRRQEREFGINTDQPTGTVQTGATLPTDGTDFVLQSIAAKLNSQSKLTGGSKNFAVLGVNLAGGSGTALASLVNDGAAVDFVTLEGTTYSISSSTRFVRGLANLIAASALVPASTIEVIDLATAGDAAKIDALLVVGLDDALGVYEDDVFQVTTDVTINPKDTFEEEGTVVKVFGAEAEGDARSIGIDNENRAQLEIHTKQNTPYMEYFSQGYKYLDANTNYGACYIDYIGEESTVDHAYVYEKQAVIYWEQTEPITLSVDGVAAGTTAINSFTPSETAPAVVAQFTTWAAL